jgi:hypothetical protein
LKERFAGQEGEEEDVSSCWVRKKILEVERGSSGSHSLENSVWKRLWTSRKTLMHMLMQYKFRRKEGYEILLKCGLV